MIKFWKYKYINVWLSLNDLSAVSVFSKCWGDIFTNRCTCWSETTHCAKWQLVWLPQSLRNSCYIRKSNGLLLSIHTQGNTMKQHRSLRELGQYQYITSSANYTHYRDKMWWNCRPTAWNSLSYFAHKNATSLFSVCFIINLFCWEKGKKG